jgi:L-ascorbate metabolism protein UlaG (beta-lactamase superfamily)
MNMFLAMMIVSAFVLTEVHESASVLTVNDLAYYKTQNTYFCRELESYFDGKKSDYDSYERKTSLCLADAVTHYPAPHDDCIKDMFLNRYKKTLDSIKKTKVDTGAVVWNIYNMSYVVKTPNVTAAFDLIRLPVSLRKDGDEATHNALAKEIAECCDILFISHLHGDHADPFVARAFLLKNKPVIANSEVFKGEDFYKKVTHWSRDGKKDTLAIGGAGTKIGVRVYPGHQAVTADSAVENNFTVVSFSNGVTIAHSGDQSWNDDFKWLDTIHRDENIDILMINTWTADPNRVRSGVRPHTILPGHIDEMGHEISSRIPFWKSYSLWENGGKKTVHLFWGEPYRYDKNAGSADK